MMRETRNKTMYIYKAYQLNIHADFPIPEFPECDDSGAPPDVVIRCGANNPLGLSDLRLVT